MAFLVAEEMEGWFQAVLDLRFEQFGHDSVLKKGTAQRMGGEVVGLSHCINGALEIRGERGYALDFIKDSPSETCRRKALGSSVAKAWVSGSSSEKSPGKQVGKALKPL